MPSLERSAVPQNGLKIGIPLSYPKLIESLPEGAEVLALNQLPRPTLPGNASSLIRQLVPRQHVHNPPHVEEHSTIMSLPERPSASGGCAKGDRSSQHVLLMHNVTTSKTFPDRRKSVGNASNNYYPLHVILFPTPEMNIESTNRWIQ